VHAWTCCRTWVDRLWSAPVDRPGARFPEHSGL